MKYVVNLNGKNYEVEVTEQEAVVTNVTAAAAAPVVAAPVAAPEAAPAAAPAVAAPSASGTNVPSPMPGTILSVNVAAGQAVKSGDVLVVLEAMKMENDIVAPCDGTVKQVLVSKGTTVNTDDILVVL